MGWTVIFIDGEYLRKIFDKVGLRNDVPKVVNEILELSNTNEKKLLRVYYYTSSPYQSSTPSEDEKERYKSFQKFEAFLKKQNNFEIKLGRIEKRGDEFEQKMVDVLLSIDLVELSTKSNIDTAILVAGDSDLVPAAKKAKFNGVKVILIYPSDKSEYHEELWVTADKRILIDYKSMKKCSYYQPQSPK